MRKRTAHARFSKVLDHVWVIGGIDEAGVDLAATTVATPTRLRLEAGTDDARPASCTYDLTGRSRTYAVDTKKADCNITYRRATAELPVTVKEIPSINRD
ncbi:hypothetical protein [Streptomyces boncukensis]|uniref:Uncharacterized protein n=1 Tax=Streptomyces boncukensis TaxID=2711219 RepID=A0A6G4X7J5_9ACTN|nr:hypothetical protein [Streptomyces boncukensis]NGO72641.1 hypothetical protein [Streptomyces boncukensis]